MHLVTDSRAERFAGKFPADEIHVVPSATIGSKNPIALAQVAVDALDAACARARGCSRG